MDEFSTLSDQTATIARFFRDNGWEVTSVDLADHMSKVYGQEFTTSGICRMMRYAAGRVPDIGYRFQLIEGGRGRGKIAKWKMVKIKNR